MAVNVSVMWKCRVVLYIFQHHGTSMPPTNSSGHWLPSSTLAYQRANQPVTYRARQFSTRNWSTPAQRRMVS